MTATHAIGIDVGGTKILGALIASDGSIGARHEIPTDVTSERALLESIDSVIGELLAGERRAAAVGLGLPSRIDQRSGRVIASVNIPFQDCDLRAHVTERFGKPTAIDNDANAAAIAEWRAGAGRGTDDMVMLTIGTGLGGGLILNGRPFRGATGVGAELGHMVVAADGRECPCGGRGHLEAYVSGRAADAAARELLGEQATAHDLVARARQGEAGPRDAIASIGRWLGAGLVTLVNVFDPDLVVVGGGFSAAGSLLLEPARAVVAREALVPARDRVQVVRARLGPDAGVIGAGMIGFDALATAAS